MIQQGTYIQRKHLADEITREIEERAKIPITATENQSYELGKVLGYMDGLKKALSYLEELPAEPRPVVGKAWHQR